MNIALVAYSIPSLDNYNLIGLFLIYPYSILLYGMSFIFNGNIGLSIILTTIIVRLTLFPLVLKQKKTITNYKPWKEEKVKIDKKYKDNNEPEIRKLKGEEVNALCDKHNFHPFKAGCMPIIYQAIILISLFQSIIRENQFSEQTFLWFVLGYKDSTYLLNMILVIALYLQMKTTSPEFFKMRLFFPPLMGFLTVLTPSAICLYIITTNIFLIFQHLVVNKYTVQKKRSLNYDKISRRV